MKIAIQAADLDAVRIDGTRVYILNLLKNFGKLDQASEFLIYHKGEFNPELTPPYFSNYKIKRISAPFFWTQTRFAREIWKDKPEVLWVPMHNTPIFRRKKMKTVVTFHDLAYKYFPEYFPKKDLFKLNLLGGHAVRHSDKIIAISESTKKDILKFYPSVDENKIKVIYHGFDSDLYLQERNFKEENRIKNQAGIKGDYILYSGAIQPRKNLETLIDAFDIFKKKTGSPIQLVIAGERAWLWEDIVKKADSSHFKKDIIMPGKLRFCDLGHLLRGAELYVFPSLYEGFGITVLEALASSVPLICAKNSSLPEVGGDAPLYFNANDPKELSLKIESILEDKNLRDEMIANGLEQIKKFSWEKCARETLEYLKS